MEEVWKDISLSCNLHNEIPTTPPHSLLRHHLPRTNIVLQDFLAGPPLKDQVAPPPPPPLHHHHHHVLPENPIDLNQMMMNVDRYGVNVVINDEDRRNRRMIKNRESAARSRARKQAYTNELELEVSHLVQDNAKLRRQCAELRSGMAAHIPAKKALQRSSSVSF